MGLLAGRRLLVARERATTSPVDWIALILLAIVIVLGIAEAMGVGLLGNHYDYRQSVSIRFRGLFAGNPDVKVIVTPRGCSRCMLSRPGPTGDQRSSVAQNRRPLLESRWLE
ncbi:respiratory nitrate reductase subunit gamma [Acidiferrimicrobium sp. IK]|uniref:respiratory nitrate reductase subunit gamma n=1 Tax=Acidiferrimicrobium sp. IK TaxID=2871700 RepID=UPI003967474D|nr:respiratory nitrate reductase subunit gamma [Acidiferrimicrobium sp. IK]